MVSFFGLFRRCFWGRVQRKGRRLVESDPPSQSTPMVRRAGSQSDNGPHPTLSIYEMDSTPLASSKKATRHSVLDAESKPGLQTKCCHPKECASEKRSRRVAGHGRMGATPRGWRAVYGLRLRSSRLRRDSLRSDRRCFWGNRAPANTPSSSASRRTNVEGARKASFTAPQNRECPFRAVPWNCTRSRAGNCPPSSRSRTRLYKNRPCRRSSR